MRKPILFVSLPVAEFRERVVECGDNDKKLSDWIRLFSRTLVMTGKNEPRDDFAMSLISDVNDYRQRRAEQVRKSRENKQYSPNNEKVQKTDIIELQPVVKPAKTEKNKFGELGNVKLSEDEEAKLRDKLGADFERAIVILSNYKAANGKSYKSDYAAILNWVVGRITEEKAKRSQSSGMSQAQRLAMQAIGGMNG